MAEPTKKPTYTITATIVNPDDDVTKRAVETKTFQETLSFAAGLITYDSEFATPPNYGMWQRISINSERAEKNGDAPRFYTDSFIQREVNTSNTFEQLTADEKQRVVILMGGSSVPSNPSLIRLRITDFDYVRGIAEFARWHEKYGVKGSKVFNEVVKGLWIGSELISNPYEFTIGRAVSIPQG